MNPHTSQKLRNHTAFHGCEIFVSFNVHGHFADFAGVLNTHFAHTFRGACEMCGRSE